MLVDRLAKALARETRSVSAQDIYAAIGARRRDRGAPRTPVKMDEGTALTHSSVWGCVRAIADPIVMADLAVYRGRQRTRRLPSNLVDPPPPFITDPTGDGMGMTELLEMALASALLTGNAWGLVTSRSGPTAARTMTMVHPDDVSWDQPRKYEPARYRVLGRPMEEWPRGPLWRWSVFRPPGSPVGLSPISHAARAIRVGIDAEVFGADWFANNAHASGILKTDQRLRGPDDEAAAKRAKAQFKDATAGRDIAVLGMGLEYQPIHIPAEDSQFLETINANAATVARFYRVQPEMIGASSGNSMTYANLETRANDHLALAVSPWSTSLEHALSRLLPRPQSVGFDLDVLIRIGMAERFTAWMTALRAGILSRNEVRVLEGRDPLEGQGDEYLWPPNSTVSVSVSGDPGSEVDVVA